LLDLVKHELDAELLEHARDQVVAAHRDAATKNQHIVVVMERADAREHFLALVLQQRASDARAAAAFERGCHRPVVARADLVRRDGLAWLDEFIARGDHGDAWRSGDLYLCAPGAGNDRDLGRVQIDAGLEQQVAGLPVGALRVNELPCAHLERRLDVGLISLARDALDRNDGIGASRQHRAGHDLHALAWRRER